MRGLRNSASSLWSRGSPLLRSIIPDTGSLTSVKHAVESLPHDQRLSLSLLHRVRNYAAENLAGSSSVENDKDHVKPGVYSSNEDLQPNGGAGTETSSLDEMRTRMSELEKVLQEQSERAKELQEKLLLSYADMENLRARMRREADNSRKFAVQEFAKSLLDVADNLERALSAVPESARTAAEEVEAALQDSSHNGSPAESGNDPAVVKGFLVPLFEGVSMTEKQLLQVFKQYGLERFDPLGEKFDPNLHNALFEIDSADKEAGTVAHVLKVGYKLHDRVIRPAEVGVTKSD